MPFWLFNLSDAAHTFFLYIILPNQGSRKQDVTPKLKRPRFIKFCFQMRLYHHLNEGKPCGEPWCLVKVPIMTNIETSETVWEKKVHITNWGLFKFIEKLIYFFFN